MIFARLQNTEDELFDRRLTPVLRLLPWQLKKMENEGPSKKEVGGGGGEEELGKSKQRVQDKDRKFNLWWIMFN